jgi:hypothetical protein
MATFLVTFPMLSPLRDCYTTIDADTEYDARLRVVDEYGTAGFGSVYPEWEKARAVDKYDLALIPFGPLRPQARNARSPK